jgi:hypothetical protein
MADKVDLSFEELLRYVGELGADQQYHLRTSLTASNVTYATPTHTVLGVTNANQVALAANASRKYALFINDSANVIYLKLGASAVVNQGIRLNANGGSYEMRSGDGTLYPGAVNAIAPVAGPSNLLITEGV